MPSLFDISDRVSDKYAFFGFQTIAFEYDLELLDFRSMGIDSENPIDEYIISSKSEYIFDIFFETTRYDEYLMILREGFEKGSHRKKMIFRKELSLFLKKYLHFFGSDLDLRLCPDIPIMMIFEILLRNPRIKEPRKSVVQIIGVSDDTIEIEDESFEHRVIISVIVFY